MFAIMADSPSLSVPTGPRGYSSEALAAVIAIPLVDSIVDSITKHGNYLISIQIGTTHTT